jgi:hypothetical protein
MIMIENYDLGITNLKFLLICFELLSGLKINYHRSKVIVMGGLTKIKQEWLLCLTVKKVPSPLDTLVSP